MERGPELDTAFEGARRGRAFAIALGLVAMAGGFSEEAAARCAEAGASARGVSLSGVYSGETFATLEGGLAETATYDGLLALGLDADLHRLGLWSGLCLHASFFQIHGRSITEYGTGSLAAVGATEAVPATRLNELWLEQGLADDMIAVRFGQLAADTEFLLSDWGGHFLNATWGWPTIAAAGIPQGGPAYPLAAPGARLALRPNDDVDVKLAVFNGLVAQPCRLKDPQRCNEHGLEFPLGDDPLFMAEAGYRYNLPGGLPGRLSLGGWHHGGDFRHQRFDTGGNLIAVTGLPGRALDGNYGTYLMLDQLVWRPAGADDETGIGLFVRAMGAPEDRNLIEFYADAGVVFAGLIPNRPDDTVAIGVVYSGISDQVSAFDVDSGLPITRSYEALIEAAYTFQLRPDWIVQPDLQYFWQPGGNLPDGSGKTAVDDVLVVGARSVIAF